MAPIGSSALATRSRQAPGRTVGSREQRRTAAATVVRALARSQKGRSPAQIQRVLRQSLTPLGVRPSSATLHTMARSIAAGEPVQLP